MEVRIDPENPAPIYVQIADSIKHQVATGHLKAGDQLPTVRQLALDLRINPNTVSRAYTELDHEGVISTQQGRGTYVSARPDQAQLARLHLERLMHMVDGMLLKALSLGYSAAEIREVFEERWANWRHIQHSNGNEEGQDGKTRNIHAQDKEEL
ncbi:MAG: GntR family transcriptional regulator [Chloroflexi bacterium]|nr:GntR family transcriptional regulator [Chloroflexota bacterium]